MSIYKFTPQMLDDLKNFEIVELPPVLLHEWKNPDPKSDKISVQKFYDYIEQKQIKHVIVQGEYGATCKLVQLLHYALEVSCYHSVFEYVWFPEGDGMTVHHKFRKYFQV